MASEAEPFIAFKYAQENDSAQSLQLEERETPRARWKSTILLHLALILLYSAITALILILNAHSCRTIYTDGPVKNLDLRYKTRYFTNLVDSPYTQEPGHNVDKAWEELLESMNIRVTAAELAHRNQTSVALTEGGGYLAWLEVFHELHCINMLRQWIYRDYYNPNLTEEDFGHWSSHADHCLDMLRQASLCHADTSLTTFVWNETKPKPMFNVHMAPRTCVDFDQLVASTQNRRVHIQEMEELQNPLMSEK